MIPLFLSAFRDKGLTIKRYIFIMMMMMMMMMCNDLMCT